MNLYSVYYYTSPSGDNPVSSFLDSLNIKQQTKILRIFQYIKTYGLSSVLPHTKKLSGTPLWEIRILGRDNIRVFYAIPLEHIILVLHGFIKKSQKTPEKDLSKALTRFDEWKTRNHLDR